MIDYAIKFDELTVKCGLVECGHMTIARFKYGLRSEIQKKMLTMQYSDLQKVIDNAILGNFHKGFRI